MQKQNPKTQAKALKAKACCESCLVLSCQLIRLTDLTFIYLPSSGAVWVKGFFLPVGFTDIARYSSLKTLHRHLSKMSFDLVQNSWDKRILARLETTKVQLKSELP